MHLVSNVTSAMLKVARASDHPLTAEATRRLRWFDHYHRHGNVSLTCRYFGISRQTFYRWQRRYDPLRVRTLENRSSRPRRVRPATWTVAQIEAVRQMRERYPAWGKAKLQILLRAEGVELSISMVGRILGYLRARRQLPVARRRIAARRRRPRRPYAMRKPPGYQVTQPGDLVQIDTLDVRPVPGVVLKHYSMHDVISRTGVLELHERATARTAAHALDALLTRLPFPVRAIQIDGGSEFMAEFEEACRSKDLRLFVLPPRSPKLNGCVERHNRTHTEEFYDWSTANPTVRELGAALATWEQIYNTVRPHQALGYLTPAQFWHAYQADPGAALAALPQNQRKERLSHR
ncbi:MAG: transposase [Mycobacterium sp.]|nr:transposase [Mycobacterium sp.]